jgi:hypothetical protein
MAEVVGYEVIHTIDNNNPKHEVVARVETFIEASRIRCGIMTKPGQQVVIRDITAGDTPVFGTGYTPSGGRVPDLEAELAATGIY